MYKVLIIVYNTMLLIDRRVRRAGTWYTDSLFVEFATNRKGRQSTKQL